MDVVVIGAGPAGMIAAIEAAKAGNKVTIIDSNNKLGRKIYSTGNGRCNYTNTNMDASYYNENARELVEKSLAKFNNNDLKKYLENLGIFTRTINGYMYPNSEQASSVAEVLANELLRLKVKIKLEEKVNDITNNSKKFKIRTNINSYTSDKLIIAVGGLAAPNLGSDGNLINIIKNLGHRFTHMHPALVGLESSDKILNFLSGVRTRAKVNLLIGDNIISSDTGEIIFNKNYVGGIPVMQLSSLCDFKANSNYYLSIDLLDEYNEEYLFNELSKRLNIYDGRTVYQSLTGILNGKLLEQIIKNAGINPDTTNDKLKNTDINKLTLTLKNFKIKLNGTLGYDKAQVTSGGIKLDEITENMKSIYNPGLYFAGEVLDVDGKCGGYNLQWAFTSGYIAGQLQ